MYCSRKNKDFSKVYIISMNLRYSFYPHLVIANVFWVICFRVDRTF